ncbi:MAG: cytochrome b5 domain-containing protein [Saccharofermentanales bacterium]
MMRNGFHPSMRPKTAELAEFVLLAITLLVLTIFGVSCSGDAPTSTASSTASASGITDGAGQTFTLEQLAQYDGKDGHRAYIAVDGIVYDVTDVPQWDSQLHAGRFVAGKDYTEELKKAPHNAGKLDQAIKIGTLVQP